MIKSVPICDGDTPIDVTEVALDDIEVAVHQDDSSGVHKTKQPESSWHRVTRCKWLPRPASCNW